VFMRLEPKGRIGEPLRSVQCKDNVV
jgi:hypothetical protein